MSFKKLDYQTGYSGLTNADIGAFLKRTLTTDEQSLVDSLITEVERDLCRATSRQFSDTVEYYEEFGSGFNKFDLYNLPIDSITKIELDGVDVTSSYTEGDNYWILDELYARFEVPLTSQDVYTGVKLTYKIRKFWGDDIKLLLKKWISVEFLSSEDGGKEVSSFSFSDLSQQFDLRGFEAKKEKIIKYYTLHQV